jgi:predicted CxxxxCH...CXXCH cytochrome family protein
MIRRFVLLLMLTLPFSLAGCSDGNHAEQPDNAPHPLDGSYLDGRNHGPDAKADLTVCQACHGEPGGPGSNPRFNRGIKSVDNTGCEACHGINYAHPVAWAGPNDTFHYTAGNIENSCTLCHGVALDGTGGVGASCLECHDSTTSFTLDCTACHGYPPDGGSDVATDTGVIHGNVADVVDHDVCVLCHGMKESDTGGSFSATTNYLLFDKTTESIGDHWNGSIEMNASTGYDQTNSGCAASCHGNDIDHRLSDSGLPVELKDFGFDETVPHPVDISFLFPSAHGPAAKGLTAAFPGGMADCQPCHAVPESGANPRFIIGILPADQGCEACHNDRTAHPSVGAKDKTHWYGNMYTHADVTDFVTMCTPCHGAHLGGQADGGVGPACTECHRADPVANPGCVSCHGLPPNGMLPAGDTQPNRPGQHIQHTGLISTDAAQSCGGCHPGSGSNAHFNGTTDMAIAAVYDAKTGGPAIHNQGSTCAGVSCHGGQTTPDWWTGSIDVDTECTACHAYGSTQYNSYYSGEHDTHVLDNGIACTACHNPAALATDHFSGLDTPVFEGEPGATISGSSIKSYDPATGYCATTCHYFTTIWK